MKAQEITLQEIKDAIGRMNGSFDQDDINDQAALVMLSAIEVGTKARALTKFTGLPQKLVSTFLARLRSNGVFHGDKIHANWLDENDGGVAFGLDVLVATGMMSRAH